MTGCFSDGIKKFLSDFSADPFHEAVMIALSNNQVNALNKFARKFRYNLDDSAVILPGESLICNRNMEIEEHMLFRGSPLLVNRIWKPEEFANMNFINAEVEFDNQDNERVRARTKILIESVTSPDGSIPLEKEKALLHEAYRRNKKFRESKRIPDDAFVNALRARYGYALTCHKAQGGEWNHVYTHPGYRHNDFRWIYTAMTRAISEVYTWTDKNDHQTGRS